MEFRPRKSPVPGQLARLTWTCGSPRGSRRMVVLGRQFAGADKRSPYADERHRRMAPGRMGKLEPDRLISFRAAAARVSHAAGGGFA
jgi:hypothetical protein